ncbi:MAG: nitrogen regulation protein NR(I), partial [SAR86 cluster bacterium]|nr:nitrogen regulation protein NR(I) [SAR86 cluster bacterium]
NERKEDISSLAKHFLKISSREIDDQETKYLSKEVEEYFIHLPWPGNVRQLENVCRWLTVMSPSLEIRIEDLPKDLIIDSSNTKQDWSAILKIWAEETLLKGETKILDLAIPEFEKTLIKAALNKAMGKKKEAAKLLGWGRNTLTRKIKEIGI